MSPGGAGADGQHCSGEPTETCARACILRSFLFASPVVK
jgi:hypothetical protein